MSRGERKNNEDYINLFIVFYVDFAYVLCGCTSLRLMQVGEGHLFLFCSNDLIKLVCFTLLLVQFILELGASIGLP
jgi:hypothetical protein